MSAVKEHGAEIILIPTTVGVGAASLLAFGWFLAFGPSPLLEYDLAPLPLLGLDLALSLVFFLQHSGMVRKPFKLWLTRFSPDRYSGAVYTLTSAIALLLLVGLWQESQVVLFSADGAARAALRVLLLAAGGGFLWSAWALHSFDPFGVRGLRDHVSGRESEPPTFVLRGPYKYVRHPIYTFVLVVIWSFPTLTADRLLFNVTWTLWIIIGAHLEERDLRASHGRQYADYQSSVPMLLPRPW